MALSVKIPHVVQKELKGEQGENGTVHRISHVAKEELNGNKGEMALSIKLHMWLWKS